ncbi:MAG: hypothetical protein KDD60_02875 [Bdellovibrionales bacterium]|nr:hypothetical protein [Bdellovibrionales bacterium]
MGELFLTSMGFSLPSASLDTTRFSNDGDEGDVAAYSSHSRRTAIQSGYIEETRNREPYEVLPNLTTSPTQLAAEAARLALAQANVSEGELGLLIGSTSTPLQTIPTESQRVGKELEVRIPAFDIYGGGADFALHLETLLAWRRDRIPDYTLSISTQIPSSRLDYSSGMERHFFGDGAGVALLSPLSGEYRVVAAKTVMDTTRATAFSIDLYGHLHCSFEIEEMVFLPQLQKLYAEVTKNISDDAVFLESQLSSSCSFRLQESLGISRNRWLSTVTDHGNMLGAGPYVGLAMLLDKGRENRSLAPRQIVSLQSGLGLSVGVVVLERVE